MSGPTIVSVASLDWATPNGTTTNNITATIQCAGRSYLNFNHRLTDRRTFLHFSSFNPNDDFEDDDDASSAAALDGGKKKKKQRNLLTLSQTKLSKLTYYQVLGDIPLHSNADQIKRAYHKSCLKYHPDKTGRGEEDEVFLLVKSAFDTLSDPMKRKSYDSTVDFDESIPKGGEAVEEFYKIYGPVFERNLRFDVRLDPARVLASKLAEEKGSTAGAGGGGGKKKKKGKNKGFSRSNSTASNNGGSMENDSNNPKECPPFGDDKTPISQVNAFYEYWIHFESWRDFTLKATEMTEHDVEAADCREEKRWMAKEIDKKARAMKRDEMSRITTLVERAMAADPRLKRERERERKEKLERERVKKEREEQIVREEKEREMKLEKEREEREAKEKEEKAAAKKDRDKEKKALRKARQLLRKLTFAAFQLDTGSTTTTKVWSDMESMNDDVELLCSKLTLDQIVSLTDALGGPDAESAPNVAALSEVKNCCIETRTGVEQKSLEAIKLRNDARAKAAKKAAQQRAARASKPWTRAELSALAKAVRKYPPGGANRWDAIALFVNNLCKPDVPRTKEECIERYNAIAQGGGSGTGGGAASGSAGGGGGGDGEKKKAAASPSTSKSKPSDKTAPAAAAAASAASNGTTTTTPTAAKSKKKDVADTTTTADDQLWTDEQDKQLQEGLAKYPASMDKNERWTAIAKCVDGKSKKECVIRFKAIRDAIKRK